MFELSCFSRASLFFFSERGLQAALPLHHFFFLFKVNNTLFLLFSSPFLKTKSVTHNTSICSFLFFIYCALSSVCAFFLMCVFIFRFSVYFSFFFQPSKKTFLLQREKKTMREGAPVEVTRCSSSFFFN